MTQKRDAKGRFVSAQDALSDFTANMAQQAGMWGGGYQDRPIVGYAKDVRVFQTFYETSWLARAAVNAVVDDAFKKGYHWVADADQITQIEAVERKFNIAKKKKQAVALSRKDGESFVYMDFGDDPASELDLSRVRRDGLRFVNVLPKNRVTKADMDKDPMSPYFGTPSYYTISGQQFHPSRIIRIVNDEDMETGEGVPVLAYMLQPIIAATTARDNVVALTTEANIDIVYVCGLMNEVASTDGASRMAQRYALLREGKATNKLAVLDKDGEAWSQRQVSFATLPDVIDTMRREVAASIGIPYALLFGSESGLGTNGESTLQTYYDGVASLQKNDIQPTFEHLDDAVIRSALGARPDGVYLEWYSLWETTDAEKANIANTLANAAKTLVDGGIVAAEVLTAPVVNALTELGAFQGIDQSYEEWLGAGNSENVDNDDNVSL